jgi:hypothetical protein
MGRNLHEKPAVGRALDHQSDRVVVMRSRIVGVFALGLLTAGCGADTQQRAASGGLAGLGVGALVGGPIGAVVGGAAGAVGGWVMPEGADQLALNAVGEEHRATSGALNDVGLGPPAEASGSSTPPAMASADVIRDKLRAQGFTHITHLQPQANGTYTAQADRGSDSYRLRIDAQSGQVVTQRRIVADAAPRGSTSTGESER